MSESYEYEIATVALDLDKVLMNKLHGQTMTASVEDLSAFNQGPQNLPWALKGDISRL